LIAAFKSRSMTNPQSQLKILSANVKLSFFAPHLEQI